MGLLAALSSLFETAASLKPKKRRQYQTVEVKVRMDCEGCERKVRKIMKQMKGVRNVEVDRKQHKLTVSGFVEEKKVVQRVRSRTGRKAEIWPYKPFYLSSAPYAGGAYDKKNPVGFVRSIAEYHAPDDIFSYGSLFSDDNINACSVM